MRYLFIFLIFVSLPVVANQYLTCYNGCMAGEDIADAIAVETGQQAEMNSYQEKDNHCYRQCQAETSNQYGNSSNYRPPVTCRPDGLGNFVCQ